MTNRTWRLLLFVLAAAAASGLNSPSTEAGLSSTGDAPASSFLVEMSTDVLGVSGDGLIVLNVTREWAPIGVDHFVELLDANFYTNNAFFRVVPVSLGLYRRQLWPPLTNLPPPAFNSQDFVVQFGERWRPYETKASRDTVA